MARERKKTERKVVLPPGHFLEKEFAKTDGSLDAYMELAFRFLGKMPVDNAPRKRKH